mmetsp:Transcript_16362/g.19352  ORF Transcript_16362/g.19352 Transcript_16362/m.19352 type:complete len:927 (+) Transcript_16362:60-2840(+)
MLSADARESSKIDRVKVLNADKDKIAKLPENYLANTNKEELCLEYVRNFNERFATLYPDKEPLYNVAENEYGVQKFVCTTLRPTLLPFRQVYDLHDAADLVANFLHYEPLEEALSPPSYLPSPSQVMEWGCGDSFDFAMLLCSFLLGAGYDAFVVHGRAPIDVCLRNQSKITCPLLVAEAEEQATLEAEAKYNQEQAESAKPSKYLMPPQASLVSAYEQAEAKLHRANRHHSNHGHGHHHRHSSHHRSEAKALNDSDWLPLEVKEEWMESEEKETGEQGEQVDPLNGKRHHCWVLVRGGKRNVEGFKFIEPSTGMIYEANDSPHGEVFAIFNDQNYFVKLPSLSSSSSSASLSQSGESSKETDEMRRRVEPHENSFDTLNRTQWECVFVDPAKLLEEKELLKENMDDGEPGSPLSAIPSPPPTMNEPSSPTASSKGGGGSSPKNSHAGALKTQLMANDFVAHDDRDNILDLPPSWVGKLSFNNGVLSLKYPPMGSRTVIYRKCKLELFADNIHNQGLVRRITIYRDEAQTVVDERREFFKNRRDKLNIRIRRPLEGKFVDSFLPGRVGGLRQMTEWAGVRREIDFYPIARQDGFLRREEDMGVKIIDRFTGRSDGMCYRSATLTEERSGAANMLWVLPAGGVRGGTYDLVAHKMAIKYERKSIPMNFEDENANLDQLAKRSFYLSEYRVRSQYHIKPGQVQPNEVTHYSDRRGSVGLGPREENELSAVILAERECLAAVKNAQLEMNELTLQRRKEESETSLALDEPIFEAAPKKLQANKNKEGDDTQREIKEGQTQPTVDYLTPFLTGLKDTTGVKLTKEEATRVRESCLRSLKERLLERANIIQNRLNVENVRLSKRQATFQRNASRDADPAAEEDFERFCADTMFTIGILEQRLVSHEESALNKYKALDEKLGKDPRLAALLT